MYRPNSTWVTCLCGWACVFLESSSRWTSSHTAHTWSPSHLQARQWPHSYIIYLLWIYKYKEINSVHFLGPFMNLYQTLTHPYVSCSVSACWPFGQTCGYMLYTHTPWFPYEASCGASERVWSSCLHRKKPFPQYGKDPNKHQLLHNKLILLFTVCFMSCDV